MRRDLQFIVLIREDLKVWRVANSTENITAKGAAKMSINESSSVPDFTKYSVETVDVVFAVLYGFVVFIGLIGNCLVLIVVYRTRSMHTTTNCLLCYGAQELTASRFIQSTLLEL